MVPHQQLKEGVGASGPPEHHSATRIPSAKRAVQFQRDGKRSQAGPRHLCEALADRRQVVLVVIQKVLRLRRP